LLGSVLKIKNWLHGELQNCAVAVVVVDNIVVIVDNIVALLLFVQPGKPKMVMEFWSGWFDHWGEEHISRKHSAAELGSETTALLGRGISINYYMFHGQCHTLPNE